MNNVGLYIHIPFCIKKCSYCDFTSFGGRLDCLPSYLCALKSEAEKFKGVNVDTVYFGGGTPSLMTAEQMQDLMCFVRQNFKVLPNAEISCECNPATVTREKMSAFKDAGINRISIGAQSLSDDVLEDIGRSHTLAQLENAICCVKEANIDNFNLDLIFALPGQTTNAWCETVKKAIKYKPSHISCYSLTLSDKTPMGKAYNEGKIVLPTEDEERKMYHDLIDILKQNEIYQYEISNFARKGNECRHNIKYWLAEEYIGLGCGVHSYFNGQRYRNTDALEKYINQDDFVCDVETLSENDKLNEKIMLGLRMNKGIDIKAFNKQFNCNFFDKYKQALGKCKDFLQIGPEFVSLNDRGIDVLDSIALEFFI